MNWVESIYGANLYDYGRETRNAYDSAYKSNEIFYLNFLSIIPGMNADRIIDHPLNKFQNGCVFMGFRFYLDWFFNSANTGYNIKPQIIDEGKEMTTYWPFNKSCGVVNIMFSHDFTINYHDYVTHVEYRRFYHAFPHDKVVEAYSGTSSHLAESKSYP